MYFIEACYKMVNCFFLIFHYTEQIYNRIYNESDVKWDKNVGLDRILDFFCVIDDGFQSNDLLQISINPSDRNQFTVKTKDFK